MKSIQPYVGIVVTVVTAELTHTFTTEKPEKGPMLPVCQLLTEIQNSAGFLLTGSRLGGLKGK